MKSNIVINWTQQEAKVLYANANPNVNIFKSKEKKHQCMALSTKSIAYNYTQNHLIDTCNYVRVTSSNSNVKALILEDYINPSSPCILNFYYLNVQV